MNRRGFLQMLAAATAVSVGGIALIETPRTFFLPPACGWGAQKLKIRWVEQYAINRDEFPIRYDATWDMPNGEARQFHVDWEPIRPADWHIRKPHYDQMARQLLEDRMRMDGGEPNSRQLILTMPRVVFDGGFLDA